MKQEKQKAGRPRKSRPAGLMGEIGERVEQLRKDKSLSQPELAELAGVALGTVSRIERGDGKPAISLIIDICRALRVAPATLFSSVKSWNTIPR
jgi:transcriptional regulator with XRE-family HTH domain